MSACDKPAQRGNPLGAGPHPELLAGFARRLVQVEHHDACLDVRPTVGQLQHPVEARHIQAHAAMERYALAVVPGACAANGERYAVLDAGRCHLEHLLHTSRPHNQVGKTPGQRGSKDWAIPVKIGGCALACQAGRVAVQPLKRLLQSEQVDLLTRPVGRGGANG